MLLHDNIVVLDSGGVLVLVTCPISALCLGAVVFIDPSMVSTDDWWDAQCVFTRVIAPV